MQGSERQRRGAPVRSARDGAFDPLLALMACVAWLTLAGCGMPFLSPDGLLVFPEPGDTGAMVITPQGVMFRDRRDLPSRINYRSPFEPWRNPVGFIAPADGRFTRTSRPTVLATDGLMVTVRPSDELAPTWGGEVMLRIDVVAAPQGARAALDVALVLDGDGPDALALVGAALAQLGSGDRVMVVDVAGPHVVVPWLPGNHRSLALAAVERRLTQDPHRFAKRGNLLGALELGWSGSEPYRVRKLVVLTDSESAATLSHRSLRSPFGQSPPLLVSSSPQAPADSLLHMGQRLGALVAVDVDPVVRAEAVRGYVPASGPIAYRNLVLRFDGSPGPSHLLEVSGGSVLRAIEADQLVLGDVRAGESRTEIGRLTMPSWTATLPFQVQLSVRFDNAQQGTERRMEALLQLPYDEDIVRIAQSRCGDVLAYASALAWMNRLRSAFLGEGIDRAGGLYRVARVHQASMQRLARDLGDPAALRQAEVLSALLEANPP